VARRLNSISGFLLLAILWEVAPRLGLADPKFFPPLSTLLVELFNLAATQEFWGYLLSTARTWATGLLVATAAGVIAGLAIGLPIIIRTAVKRGREKRARQQVLGPPPGGWPHYQGWQGYVAPGPVTAPPTRPPTGPPTGPWAPPSGPPAG